MIFGRNLFVYTNNIFFNIAKNFYHVVLKVTNFLVLKVTYFHQFSSLKQLYPSADNCFWFFKKVLDILNKMASLIQ